MKMKAAILVAKNRFEIQQIERPEISLPTDVLVRTRAIGVCGSDLQAWNGVHNHVTMPAILGHEVVGEVVEVGSAVTDLTPGDRVALEPIEYCGHCYACRNGQPNVCRSLKVRGFELDGGHREYFIADHSKLHKFPSEIDWICASMIEPYTIAAQVNMRANTRPGDVVLIHGLGPAGLSIGDWAKRLSAVVIGSDMVDKRLDIARSFGFDYVLNPAETNISRFVHDLTDGEGANVIIEACGVTKLLTEAVDLISPAGRIVPITFHFEPTGISSGLLNAKEASIIGSRLQSGRFPVVIEHLSDHLDHIRQLVTHVLPFEQMNKAFALAASRDPAVGKVVVSLEERS